MLAAEVVEWVVWRLWRPLEGSRNLAPECITMQPVHDSDCAMFLWGLVTDVLLAAAGICWAAAGPPISPRMGTPYFRHVVVGRLNFLHPAIISLNLQDPCFCTTAFNSRPLESLPTLQHAARSSGCSR